MQTLINYLPVIVLVLAVVITVLSILRARSNRKLAERLTDKVEDLGQQVVDLRRVNRELAEADNSRPILSAVITKGARKKFRFTVRDGKGKLVALAGPTGYGSAGEAKAVLMLLGNAKIKLESGDAS